MFTLVAAAWLALLAQPRMAQPRMRMARIPMPRGLANAAAMSMTPNTPLGHRIGSADAPVKLEAWYDFSCPFSAKSFLMLTQNVLPAIEEKAPGQVQFLHYQYPQPWHAPGAYAAEVSLAVELVEPAAYLATCTHFFEHQDELVFDCVSYDMTRSGMYNLLAHAAQKASGVDAEAVLEKVQFLGTSPNAGNAVGQLVKWYAKHGRKNGIHVTPTVLVNGIEETSISSGWTQEQWDDYLAEKLAGRTDNMAAARPVEAKPEPVAIPETSPAPLATPEVSQEPVAMLGAKEQAEENEAADDDVARLEARLEALREEGLRVRVQVAEARDQAQRRKSKQKVLEEQLRAEGYNALVARRAAAQTGEDEGLLGAKREADKMNSDFQIRPPGS